MVFVQPGMADVRSTGAGIKCLYCTVKKVHVYTRRWMCRGLVVTMREFVGSSHRWISKRVGLVAIVAIVPVGYTITYSARAHF